MSQNSRQLDQQRKARVAARKLLAMTSAEFSRHHTGRAAQVKRDQQLSASGNIFKLIAKNQSEPANRLA